MHGPSLGKVKREHGRGNPIRGRPRDCKQRVGAKRHWIGRSGKAAQAKRCEPGDLPCAKFFKRPPEGRLEVSHEHLSGASQSHLPQLPMMDCAIEPDVTLFVCVTCRPAEEEGVRPGKALFEALRKRLDGHAENNVALRAVECLSVCKRPCTIALSAPGKWTYVVGDLDIDANAGDIIDAALKFAATSDGLIPWRERPLSFRKGVISRVPPLTQSLEKV
jgi:predicted metal-binding protein